MSQDAARELARATEELDRLIHRDIVGMDEVIRLLMVGVFSGGHCLLVGVPGLAKTKLISTLARLLDLEFSRIQFTPDLMPSDITGAEVIVEDKETGDREFEFMKGPLFANVVLADEINRTPPKTQAALMEAMEEGQVSSLGRRFPLEAPFFVLATQNPIEQEGTYPLPTAQLDRFIFNIDVGYPDRDQEAAIVRLGARGDAKEETRVMGREEVLRLQASVRELDAPLEVVRYATELVRCSRPDENGAPEVVNKYFSFGAGPRAAQALVLGSKVLAMMRGETRPTPADVRTLFGPVMRHRVVLNFLGAAEGVSIDELLDRLVHAVPAPDGPLEVKDESPSLLARLGAVFRR